MKISNKYRLLQGSYWVTHSACYSFASVFMLGCGFTAGNIGVMIAVFCTVSALIQPILGRSVDRGSNWRRMTIILTAIVLGLGLAVCLTGVSLWSVAPYGIAMLAVDLITPFVNSANFYYQQRGEKIDFGSARGIGSLSCAILALVMGQITGRLGIMAVPGAMTLLAFVLLIVTFSMPELNDGPQTGDAEKAPVKSGKQPATARRGGSFIKRYPAFTRMLAACVLLMAFHNMTNTYHIQMLEAVGGDSGSLGTSLAIAAFIELPVMFSFGRIVKRVTPGRLMLISSVAFIAKGVGFALAGSVNMMYATQLLQMFSFAIYASASVYYTQSCMAPEDIVTGQALIASAATLGKVTGNLLGGFIIDSAGVQAMLIAGIVITILSTVLVASAQKPDSAPVMSAAQQC